MGGREREKGGQDMETERVRQKEKANTFPQVMVCLFISYGKDPKRSITLRQIYISFIKSLRLKITK